MNKKTNLNTLSLFTGAGGLDLGFEEAGFEIVGAVEWDEDCCKTLRPNFDFKVVERDIREISPEEILEEIGKTVREIGTVIAGPPCQSFSKLGKRNGLEDERGELFWELIDILEYVNPHTFVVENVPGILNVGDGKVPKKLSEKFRKMGYEVNIDLLNSADYGVPQKRKRVFFLCNKDFKLKFPKKTHSKNSNDGRKNWRTVGETLSKITEEDKNRNDNFSMNHTQKVVERMKEIDQGENFHALPMDMRPECWKTGKHQGSDTFGRLEEEKPSVAIRTEAYNPTKGKYIHPRENRGLSTLEMALLQSFPKEFRFSGESMKSVSKQIGNAVPPKLAEIIAKAVRNQIGSNIKKEIKLKRKNNVDLDLFEQKELTEV